MTSPNKSSTQPDSGVSADLKALENPSFLPLLKQLVAGIAESNTDDTGQLDHELDSLRDQILEDVPCESTEVTATFHVLVDLVRQGYRLSFNNDRLELFRDNLDEHPQLPVGENRRQELRRQNQRIRSAQLRQNSVRRFIKRCEKSRTAPTGRRSIFDLMRNGEQLAETLRETDDLSSTIQPYIQSVTGDDRCQFTGLKLKDIWRYFRHTWSNVHHSIPGRSMMLLVRDAAAPCHPVIGISAISSTVANNRSRDLQIGWEPGVFTRSLEKSLNSRRASWLLNIPDQLLSEIYTTDFFAEGIVSPAQLKKPTEELVARLQKLSVDEREQHRKNGEASDHKSTSKPDDWEEYARTSLYRSKRAGELASLLRTQMVFAELAPSGSDLERAKQILGTSAGKSTVQSLIRRMKGLTVGTAIAELSVCGAIPPYNELLGGKLTAALSVSPAAIAAYRNRYNDHSSIIASSMAAKDVVRPADLVFVSTSSLYGIRPCQYDRISIPRAVLGNSSTNGLRYSPCKERTVGIGTFHFGDDTTTAIQKYLETTGEGTRRVKYIFGEGASPKLRALRDGLKQLGFDQQELLNHRMPRAVFGVRLIENLAEYLVGLDDTPHYFWGQPDSDETTAAIGRWWLDRWVTSRLKGRPEIIDRIASHNFNWPVRHGGRVVLPPLGDETPALFEWQ